MKVFSTSEFNAWDAFTLKNEPIASIDLMERASFQVVTHLITRIDKQTPVVVFCGPGNNGGDGLAIARMLHLAGFSTCVYLIGDENKRSVDFNTNLERYSQFAGFQGHIQSESKLPDLDKGSIVIDALLGIGTNRPATGLFANIIKHINNSGSQVVAIDIPSGLNPDALDQNPDSASINANVTYTFQSPKRGLISQSNKQVGELVVLDIGLHKDFYQAQESSVIYVDEAVVQSRWIKRELQAEKRDLGSSLIIGGSEGMMGAVILALRACLHSGSGLTASFIPAVGIETIQIAVPEATALKSRSDTYHAEIDERIINFSAVGIGPGLGMEKATGKFVANILSSCKKPMIIDADALNHISRESLLTYIPAGSLLTPHKREFERLFGEANSERKRMEQQVEQSQKLQIYILRKGRFSVLTTPDGLTYINSTGNSGMAKGGSGDVLTGILTGLFARTGHMKSAAIIGMYMHGLAGDLAAIDKGMESMIASDLIDKLPEVFKKVFGA